MQFKLGQNGLISQESDAKQHLRIRRQYKTPLGAHVQEVRFVSPHFSAYLQPAQNYNASSSALQAIIRAIASAKWERKPHMRQTAKRIKY